MNDSDEIVVRVRRGLLKDLLRCEDFEFPDRDDADEAERAALRAQVGICEHHYYRAECIYRNCRENALAYIVPPPAICIKDEAAFLADLERSTARVMAEVLAQIETAKRGRRPGLAPLRDPFGPNYQ